MEIEGNYQKMILLIKELIDDMSDDDFIFDKEVQVTWKADGKPLFKSEFLCVFMKMKCETLLKEIGEMK
jgi:hypothetical protein